MAITNGIEIHISDEEGLDGEALYRRLPDHVKVFRNFYHPRLFNIKKITTFPIGPRIEFLGSSSQRLSSERNYPWTFMGTLWPSGSRKIAVSHFLAKLPSGIYFGGQNFGVGLPLKAYQTNLLNSVFALCPEGDRHFDTFRLYESLQMGAIPLVVEREGQARELLGSDFPIPIHSSWQSAFNFAVHYHQDMDSIDHFQHLSQLWWRNYKNKLSKQLKDSLFR